MNWDRLAEYGIPAVIGAGSALISVYMANRFSAKQQKREFALRRKELDQRLIEALIPIRIAAINTVFSEVQALKDGKRDVGMVVAALEPHLIWLDDGLVKHVAGAIAKLRSSRSITDDLRGELTDVQEQCRAHCGATRLNRLYTSEG